MADGAQTVMSGALAELFSGYAGPPFAVRLWDGSKWRSPGADQPLFTLAVNSEGALHSLAFEGSEVALGEAFIHGELDVEGDLFSAFDMVAHVLSRPAGLRDSLRGKLVRQAFAVARTVKLGLPHSQARDRSSIAYHYDQPVEFFRPWLGPTLVYSCAYFHSEDDSLDQAQMQKLDLICRKLRLKPGERFLDFGCGWGSLVLHAAGSYNAEVCGITLSATQARVAAQRVEDAGLGDRCKVLLEDYRQFGKGEHTFDKMASVGMYEHVGLKNLPVYFGIAWRMLRPGGCFLNHGIARSARSAPRGSDSFIGRYVFPDGELVTLTEAIEAAEAAGFEVRDVENLREHYAITLRRWVDGLQRNRDRLLQIVSETTCRIWLLYMAGCAAAFHRGDIGLYQVLLSRPDRGRSCLPLVREDWYGPAQP
jgi:cyclopropane-fatty-acyl-phospholipid synthase